MSTNVIDMHSRAPHIQPNRQINLQRVDDLVARTLGEPVFLLVWEHPRTGRMCISSHDEARIARQMQSLADQKILAKVVYGAKCVGGVMRMTCLDGFEFWQACINGRVLPALPQRERTF